MKDRQQIMLWNNEGFIIIHFSGSLSEFYVSYGVCFGRLHISSTKGKSQLSFYKDRDSLLRRMEDLYHHLSKTTQILLLLAQQIFLHHLHHFVIITIIITLIIVITIFIIVIVIMEGKKTAQKQKERFVKAKVSSHSHASLHFPPLSISGMVMMSLLKKDHASTFSSYPIEVASVIDRKGLAHAGSWFMTEG